MADVMCPQCGTAVREGAQFCTDCGGRMGAVPSSTAPVAAAAPAPPSAPEVNPGDASAPKRSKGKVALLGVGVAALAGVGLFAYQGLSGESGGAESPEAAVQQMAAALDAEDPAGVADAMAPDEVQTLGELIATVEDRASSSGLGGKKDPYTGLDLSVEDLELSTDELSDTVARVDIEDGKGKLKIDADKLTAQGKNALGEEDSWTIERDDLVGEFYDSDRDRDIEVDPFVMVVKRDGGWYVSPTYTAAAWIAEANGYDDGEFDDEVPDDLDVAETPEAAVVELANSIEELDPEATLASVPSAEWSMLWAYRDAITDLVDEATDGEQSFTFEVDDSDMKVSDLPGGRKRVEIAGASGTSSTIDDGDENEYDWELDGTCVTWEGPDDSDEACLEGDGEDTVFTALDITNPYVVVEPERGGWVVSPMATVLQWGKDYLPKVSDAWLYGGLGLERLAPPAGTLTLGEPVEATFNEAGFVVYALPLEEGQLTAFEATGDGYDWYDLYGPGGESEYGLFGGYRKVEEPGIYTVVLTGEAGTDVSVEIAAVVEQELPASRTAKGDLSKDGPLGVYSFTVDEAGSYAINVLDGNVAAEIVGDELYDSCYADTDDPEGYGTCALEADTDYQLRVSPYDDEPGAYEVAVVVGPDLSIDGGASASGEAVADQIDNEDQQYHDVVVPDGGSAIITLTFSGDSDTDFDLFCESESVCIGSDSSGPDSEEIIISGPFEGSIIVDPYSGSGSYTVTIEEY